MAKRKLFNRLRRKMKKYFKIGKHNLLGYEKMKFSDKRYEETYHIYARGKGENTTIVLRHIDSTDNFYLELDINEAKELNIYLQNAIQDAEKRSLIECGED